MKILAISQLDPTKDGSALLQAEKEQTYELLNSGRVPEMYWKTDNSGAVFLFESDSLSAAEKMLNELPYVQHEITTFTLLPIVSLESAFPR